MFDATRRSVKGALGDRSVRETVRASALFGLLAVVLLGIAGHLMFRELDLQVMSERMDAAWNEARRIADVISAIGRDRDGIDFRRIRENRRALESIVNDRIEGRRFVRYVEVRDRFGAQLLFVARDRVPGGPVALLPREVPAGETFPASTRVVSVALDGAGDAPAGEIRVGLAENTVQRELIALRRSLRIQIFAAAAAGVLVLVVGLFYVLHLIRKNRRLEQSRIAAERRSYVGLLASGLAHEIRNPLNAMNMNLQMLEEELQLAPGQGPDDASELLDQTKREIKRLEQLVSNFLTYARPAVPQFRSHDLNEVLQQVCRFLEADFRASDVALTFEGEPMLPSVELDETQFKQAVMNLLVNARQVLRGGGRVEIRTRAGAGGDVVMEITDDGPGIPEEARERIFDVFYSNRGGGTGLGLPIARQIVQRHGGSIEVETAVGEGTTFRIRLPRRHPAASTLRALEPSS